MWVPVLVFCAFSSPDEVHLTVRLWLSISWPQGWSLQILLTIIQWLVFLYFLIGSAWFEVLSCWRLVFFGPVLLTTACASEIKLKSF